MKRIKAIVIVGLLLIAMPLYAQYKINGTVYDLETGQALEGINILLSRPRTLSVVSYILTDAQGKYCIKADSALDSLQITVSGFNIRTEKRIISKGNHNIDFRVIKGPIEIREAIVASDPIRRNGDTLTYYVEQFRIQTDHGIGDVLKRMPGLEVGDNGAIRYNGVPINRFYIEGLDMLSGNYGLAVNNVLASDIASVEIYENHQPEKVLEKWVRSDQAALNLKLKEGARGTWTGIAEVGSGYKPIMWDFRLTPMYFSKNFQTILTYKTNNAGDDVARELSPLFGYNVDIPELLGVVSPTTPPLDAELWLNNNIHAVSANAIRKIGEGKTFTAKAHYIHDIQKSSSLNQTIYYLEDNPPFSIGESMSANSKINNFHADIMYNMNTSKLYLQEQIKIELKHKEDDVDVLNDASNISQQVTLPFVKISNLLSFTKGFEKWRLSTYSNTYYAKRYSQLEIIPNPYLATFLNEDEILRQTVNSEKILSSNLANTSYSFHNWIFGISASLQLEAEKLFSQLGTIDSLNNNITWERIEGELSASANWHPSRRLTIDLSIPVRLSHSSMSDYLPNRREINKSLPIFNPSLSLKYIYNQDFTTRLTAQHYQQLSGLYDMYEGFIMQNYRNLIAKGGVLNKVRHTTALCAFTYSNSIYALFINGQATGWITNREGAYGVKYDDILITTSYIPTPNSSSGISFIIDASKRLYGLKTTIKSSVSWSRSWNEYFRQEQWMSSIGDNWASRFEISSRIKENIIVSYEGKYDGYHSFLSGNIGIPSIHAIQQKLGVNYIIGKQIRAGISAKHYYNNTLENKLDNMLFLNANIVFSLGRWEFKIEGNNLLNTKQYGTAMFSANTYRSYLYELRPRSIVLKVRFSLR